MATRLTAQQIANEALRVVGELSPRDTAPRQNVAEITLLWLDIVVSELCATEPVRWMQPDVVKFDLSAGKFDYVFGKDDRQDTRPAAGVEFLSSIIVVDASGYRTPINIIPFTEFKELRDIAGRGFPHSAAFNRATSTVSFDSMFGPTAPDSTETGYIAEMVVQSYAPTLFTTDNQSKRFDLGAAWNRWAIMATAYEISGGPVRRLPEGERSAIKADRDEAKITLLSAENMTKGTGKRVRFRMPM